MIRPHHAPLFTAACFLSELDVEVADSPFRLLGGSIAGAVAVRIRVAVVVVAVARLAAAVAVSAAPSARVSSVIHIKLLFLALPETDGADVGLLVVLSEGRGGGRCL